MHIFFLALSLSDLFSCRIQYDRDNIHRRMECLLCFFYNVSNCQQIKIWNEQFKNGLCGATITKIAVFAIESVGVKNHFFLHDKKCTHHKFIILVVFVCAAALKAMTENRFAEITCAKLPLSSSELLILPSICCFQPYLDFGPCAVQRIVQSIYEKRMNAQKNSKSTTNKEIKPNRFEYFIGHCI